MNRINSFALALVGVLALLFSSCEKAPFITMTGPRSFNFTRDGGSQSITFSCNRPWSVSSTESWIQITPSSGEANDKDITVTIKCSPNTTYDPRSATVTVKLEELSESITITQDTGIGLLVSPTTFELTNAAQVIEIEVQKNVQYSVAIDNESAKWIMQGGTKALTTDKVTFTISANESYDNREGKIVFKQLDGNLSQTVIVRQSQTNGMFITTSEYNLSNEAHYLSVEVKANVEFEVTSQAEWIKFVETKALTPSTISLSIDANETYDNRTGIVLVKQKNGDLTGTITVNQKQTDYMTITPTSFEVSNAAETVTIEVKNNVEYSVVIPDDAKSWISVQTNTQTKALVDDQVVLAIAKNATYDDREASITIKQVDGALAGTVAIKQAYGEGLIVEKAEYNVGIEEKSIEVTVQSNVEYNVQSEVEWISIITTKALSTSTINLFVEENETYSDRVGTVKVSQINGALQQFITINQDGRIAVTSIKLDATEKELEIGDQIQLIATVCPDNATDKEVKWASSDSSIATVDESGNVAAIKTGKIKIIAKAGEFSAECSISVRPQNSVDLGLSVFWAKSNLCSDGFESAPEKYGNYFSWGEIEPKIVYWWSNYKWCNGSMDSLTKYNTVSSKGYVDNIIVLEDADDAAHVILGGNWRLPTKEEMKELVNNCTYKWTTLNGINGMLFTSKINSKTLFLPASGGYGANVGVLGTYWNSSLLTEYPENGGAMGFARDGALGVEGGARRNEGNTIRAVSK